MVERERVPQTTDILASYEVEIDDEGELTGYERASAGITGTKPCPSISGPSRPAAGRPSGRVGLPTPGSPKSASGASAETKMTDPYTRSSDARTEARHFGKSLEAE